MSGTVKAPAKPVKPRAAKAPGKPQAPGSRSRPLRVTPPPKPGTGR